MTNIELLDYSGAHPVPLIDSYYNKDKIVIPLSKDESNELTRANDRLIDLITVFDYMNADGRREDDAEIRALVEKVIRILDDVDGINFSAFSQFFMVYNSAYSSYAVYEPDKKRKFVYEMLCRYCRERHGMYKSHGYSSAILQVMCDNYSHKRNSKTTIDKIVDAIEPVGFSRHKSGSFVNGANRSYILPDKGDSASYQSMSTALHLETRALRQEQGKLPDFVFKVGGEYYIGEAKMMKGSGGGQDKQLVEIINFIRYSEANPHVHYVVYFDGEYANMLLSSASRSPKIARQYQDIVENLTANPGNCFVNPAGFEVFLQGLPQ